MNVLSIHRQFASSSPQTHACKELIQALTDMHVTTQQQQCKHYNVAIDTWVAKWHLISLRDVHIHIPLLQRELH